MPAENGMEIDLKLSRGRWSALAPVRVVEYYEKPRSFRKLVMVDD